MSRQRDITYSLLQQQVKCKDVAVNTFIDRTLCFMQSAFVWENLPETIPQKELERLLQTRGNVFVCKHNDNLWAFNGSKGGVLDVYDRPTTYSVAVPFLNLSHTYDINQDGVLIENDSAGNSLIPVIGKYAVLYTDGLISLNTASVLARITMLISASDDKTKQSADLFVRKILDGDFSVIGENAFFKGVAAQNLTQGNSQLITQLIELLQYYKANMCHDLGLNANYNMKRERLNLGEISTNIDALLPYMDDMLRNRRAAADRINEMFGTDIHVSLGSSWALQHENYEKIYEDTATTLNIDTGTETDEQARENDTDEQPSDEQPSDDQPSDDINPQQDTDNEDIRNKQTE